MFLSSHLVGVKCVCRETQMSAVKVMLTRGLMKCVCLAVDLYVGLCLCVSLCSFSFPLVEECMCIVLCVRVWCQISTPT